MSLLRVVPASRSGDTDASLETLLLECGFVEIRPGDAVLTETFVDTHDGRLYARDLRLVHEHPGSRWRLEANGAVRAEQPGGLADGLAEGPVARVVDLSRNRQAFVPCVAVRRETRRFQIPGTGSGEPVRFNVEDLTWIDPLTREERPGPRVLVVAGEAGDAAGADALHFLLTRLPGGAAETFDPLTEGLRAFGLRPPGPPDRPEFRVHSEDSLALALGKILRRQAYVIESLRRGVVYDLDIEFLHRMRVATRRARSALKLFGKLAPRKGPVLRRELAALAGTLGRVRDLDVLLRALPAQLARIDATDETADAITRGFRTRRQAAQEAAVRALEDPVFDRLVQSLRECAGTLTRSPKTAGAAAPRAIGKALRRIERRVPGSRRWTEDDLHRLRIAFKRLRYTAEFFFDVEDDRARVGIRKIVRFQDELGAIQDVRMLNDMYGQLAGVECAGPRSRPEIVLTLGRLDEANRRDLVRLRSRFHRRWRKFPRQSRRLRKRFRSMDRDGESS